MFDEDLQGIGAEAVSADRGEHICVRGFIQSRWLAEGGRGGV